jgi:5'-methylthioadenosine phosphorylase
MTQPLGLPAIIGGTGVHLRGPDSPLSHARDEIVMTRWGTARVTHAEYSGRAIIFLHRHAAPDGSARTVPPHAINYRANIAALKKLGVSGVFASTAVGSLRAAWPPGTLVLLDDFMDGTSGRAATFFDENAVHIDLTEPYCPALRALLRATAARLETELHDGGTYFCANGPRFETPAEIRAYARGGADLVGMTGVPEATLAREAQLSYAGVSIVTNAAAGLGAQPLTQSEVLAAMNAALPRVARLLLEASLYYTDDPARPARNATAEFAGAQFDPQLFIIDERKPAR